MGALHSPWNTKLVVVTIVLKAKLKQYVFSLRLERETPAFISADLRPSNSTDLNPGDYKIWEEMQLQVYQVHDLDELKQRLIDVRHMVLSSHQ